MANNNIEQYLEAMLAALDGDTVPDVPSPSWNIEKYLAAILTKLSSGGGSGNALPPITDADNGKVLTANSGAWVAANPSGGKENIILYLKPSDFTENKPMDIYTSPLYNQTITESDFDEIYAKYRKNANIVFKSNNDLYFPIIVKMKKQGTTRTIDAVIGHSSGYQGGTATVTMKQVWYSYSEEVSS